MEGERQEGNPKMIVELRIWFQACGKTLHQVGMGTYSGYKLLGSSHGSGVIWVSHGVTRSRKVKQKNLAVSGIPSL